VGKLHATSRRVIPIQPLNATVAAASDHQWWTTYDPTHESRCGGCSFLPLCWGGCPKHHLERDAQALQEQCGYWRRNLARYVLTPWIDAATLTREALAELDDTAQFRPGTSASREACTGG
jgi:uncharacterized protein